MHVTVTLRPSIRQVAERAGVSRMTVSRVLNDRTQQVSEETRERVMKAVRELEYVPVSQPTIQSRHAETRILGLIFDGTLIDDVWGLPTFLGLREAASTHDYDLLTLLRSRPNWMVDQEELRFLDRRNDGCIFIRPENRYEIIQTLVAHRLPVVACYTTDVPPEVPTIVLDNAGAMEQVVEHLIEQGHRRILHLNNLQHRSDFRERRRGFEQAIRKHDMEPIVLNVDDIFATDAGSNLLATVREHGITAIACASDYLASFAWDAAESHGLEIPQDLSITGMDNLVEPAKRGLTSIHFSCEEVGRQAVESIVSLIQGDAGLAKCTVVPVHLIQRSSVAEPRPFPSAVETGRVLHHRATA